jgi:hypothetical protein
MTDFVIFQKNKKIFFWKISRLDKEISTEEFPKEKRIFFSYLDRETALWTLFGILGDPVLGLDLITQVLKARTATISPLQIGLGFLIGSLIFFGQKFFVAIIGAGLNSVESAFAVNAENVGAARTASGVGVALLDDGLIAPGSRTVDDILHGGKGRVQLELLIFLPVGWLDGNLNVERIQFFLTFQTLQLVDGAVLDQGATQASHAFLADKMPAVGQADEVGAREGLEADSATVLLLLENHHHSVFVELNA